VQLTFVGDKVISVYRHGDYPDITRATVSADRSIASFSWAGGEANLQRIDRRTARIALHERGYPDRAFVVQHEGSDR
jgi:hypothetical protein